MTVGPIGPTYPSFDQNLAGAKAALTGALGRFGTSETADPEAPMFGLKSDLSTAGAFLNSAVDHPGGTPSRMAVQYAIRAGLAVRDSVSALTFLTTGTADLDAVHGQVSDALALIAKAQALVG
jgi:hypothetical protein